MLRGQRQRRNSIHAVCKGRERDVNHRFVFVGQRENKKKYKLSVMSCVPSVTSSMQTAGEARACYICLDEGGELLQGMCA